MREHSFVYPVLFNEKRVSALINACFMLGSQSFYHNVYFTSYSLIERKRKN